MADNYVCTLDAASLNKAKKELGEEPKERLSQVETLRTWILQQPHFKCPTGTEYLLRFLRHCKFSQLRARKMVEAYMKMRNDMPEWLVDLDTGNTMFHKFLESGYYLVMPQRDKEGRKILVVRVGCFTPDSKMFDKDVIIKGIFALNNYILAEENAMVNGCLMLIDFSDFTLKHQTFWGMDALTKTTKMWQSLPGRMKGFHYYNIGPIFEGIMAIMRPLLSKKFQERIVLHGNNMESVYKVIPMEYLPREYLPDDYKGPCQGTVKELAANLINDIKRPEVRDRILYETSTEWTYTKDEKPDDIPNESFRKLNVD